MNEIDRRAFFASLLGAAVMTGVAAKIPGLSEALARQGLDLDALVRKMSQDIVIRVFHEICIRAQKNLLGQLYPDYRGPWKVQWIDEPGEFPLLLPGPPST